MNPARIGKTTEEVYDAALAGIRTWINRLGSISCMMGMSSSSLCCMMVISVLRTSCLKEFKWVSPRGWRSNDDECFSLSKEWTTSTKGNLAFQGCIRGGLLANVDHMSITIASSLLEVPFTSGRIQFDKFA